jgi:hypothetical protein
LLTQGFFCLKDLQKKFISEVKRFFLLLVREHFECLDVSNLGSGMEIFSLLLQFINTEQEDLFCGKGQNSEERPRYVRSYA